MCKFNFLFLAVATKKIISIIIKLLIGAISFYIIYNRLNSIPNFKEQCYQWFSQPSVFFVLFFALLLMPLNWGIESYKWNIITKQLENLPYKTSVKAVLAGICIGNVAPGRAMEFLAKIYYFKPHNRPSATILHFINGMFQMVITVTVGLIAIAYKLYHLHQSINFVYAALFSGVLMIVFFCWAIFNVHWIQQKLQMIKWFKKMDGSVHLHFEKAMIVKLISLSILRYAVFTCQFFIIYKTLVPQSDVFQVFESVAAYFVITSVIPMISFIEPAIRAAIAILVFNNATDNEAVVVITTTILWLINVVLPSILGYIIILREKIQFKNTSSH